MPLCSKSGLGILLGGETCAGGETRMMIHCLISNFCPATSSMDRTGSSYRLSWMREGVSKLVRPALQLGDTRTVSGILKLSTSLQVLKEDEEERFWPAFKKDVPGIDF